MYLLILLTGRVIDILRVLNKTYKVNSFSEHAPGVKTNKKSKLQSDSMVALLYFHTMPKS